MDWVWWSSLWSLWAALPWVGRWFHSKQPVSCVKESMSNSPDQPSPLDSEGQKSPCFQVPPHLPPQWCLSHTRTPNATYCPSHPVWALQPCPAWGVSAARLSPTVPVAVGPVKQPQPTHIQQDQLIPVSSLESTVWGDLLTDSGRRTLLWLQD